MFSREKSSKEFPLFCLSLSLSLSLYIYIYMPMEGEIYRHRFIIGIGLHSYGSLPPAFCKLENQEIWWCNSAWVRRPKNQESQGHKPQSRSEGLRTRASVWGQGKVKVLDQAKGANLLSLCLSVLSRTSRDWIMPIYMSEDWLSLPIHMPNLF